VGAFLNRRKRAATLKQVYMKRLFPSTLLGQLVLTAVLTLAAYALFIYVVSPLLIPTEWGGATQ
jgi:hypothetical protein